MLHDVHFDVVSDCNFLAFCALACCADAGRTSKRELKTGMGRDGPAPGSYDVGTGARGTRARVNTAGTYAPDPVRSGLTLESKGTATCTSFFGTFLPRFLTSCPTPYSADIILYLVCPCLRDVD